MPELAEVYYYASQWDPGHGHPITEVHLHPQARIFRQLPRPQRLIEAVQGQPFAETRTHGKQCFFRFGDVWLAGHLGMSGHLSVAKPTKAPGRHDHLVLRQAARQLVYTDPRMFGSWYLLDHSAMTAFWETLPPEVTSPRFTKERLHRFLQRRTRRPIKGTLLDQSLFPGIGNWMADEVLWRCHLDPRRPAGSLSKEETADLWKKLRLVCRQAMRIIGTSWGDPPPKTWLFPHRWKDGGRCPCGAPLVRETIAGRTTCWCPTCQES